VSDSTLRLTIRRKVFLLVLLPSFLAVSLVTLYSFLGNRFAATDQIKHGLTDRARNYAGRVDALLNQIVHSSEATAHFLSNTERTNDDDLYEILRQVVAGNPLIHGAVIAFEPGAHLSGRRFGPYVYRDGENFKTMDIGVDAEVFSEQAFDWYDNAKLKAKSTWSEPYRIAREDMTNVITFSTPIFRYEKIVGVAAIEIDLAKLVERAGIPRDESTSVFVVSRGGSLVIHHDLLAVTEPLITAEIPLARGGRGLLLNAVAGNFIETATPSGNPVWLNMADIPTAQARLFVQTDPRTALGIIDTLGTRSAYLTILVLAISTLVSVLFFSRIVRPLRELSVAVQNVARGDLSVPAVKTANDEIGDLAKNFVAMTQSLSAREQAMAGMNEELRNGQLTAQRALHELQNQKFAIDQHAIVTVLDATGNIVYVNDRYCQVSGYTKEEVVGQDHRILASHHQSHEATVEFYRVLESGKVWQGELSERAKNGNQIWVNATVVPFLDRNGAIEQFVSIRTDITEHKRTELDLRIAAVAFESQDGILVADSKSVILRINQAFIDMTGISATKMVGKPLATLMSKRHDEEFLAVVANAVMAMGAWQGEAWGRRNHGNDYPAWVSITEVNDKSSVSRHYVASVTDITARKAAEAEIEQLAYFDSLTKLANRRLLMDRLEHALAHRARSGREGGLLFIDLDNFKAINDALGHGVGDNLLRQVAERLQSCVRKTETVARLGGDEFVVMVEDLSPGLGEAALQMEAMGTKIHTALNQPYLLAGRKFQNTPSIGVALFGTENSSADELMKRADIAMYQAKRTGRNAIRFFDPKMQAAVEYRADLGLALREAIANDQLVLYYQMQVAHGRGATGTRATGAEVLLRWHHPTRGMISPNQFIPVAEETGLIVPIGMWALRTACEQIKQWQGNPGREHLQLAVNVSARQFSQADFCAQVISMINTLGIDPSLLKIELTESTMPDDVAEIIATMRTLSQLGVQFSLDDFGTGHSALSSLKKLPLHQLKIDQSFVRDIVNDQDDAVIVQTIIAMANSLGMQVLAEGVESEEQKEILINRGCEHFQGFLFGRPVPIQEFERQLGSGKRTRT
jgi:diguanylate cyclase (GGDEF)-like protein/PAS domain S-box-containing protein